VSLEANFGQDPGRPFKFDMDKCPELAFEWNFTEGFEITNPFSTQFDVWILLKWINWFISQIHQINYEVRKHVILIIFSNWKESAINSIENFIQISLRKYNISNKYFLNLELFHFLDQINYLALFPNVPSTYIIILSNFF
jgi:hypothetical protein